MMKKLLSVMAVCLLVTVVVCSGGIGAIGDVELASNPVITDAKLV